MMLYIFRIVDKLIKQMFAYHKGEWIKVGKPCGIFFRPIESKNIRSMISMQINLFKWFFITPKWIKEDEIAKAYLSSIRRITIIANLIILGIFGYIISLIL